MLNHNVTVFLRLTSNKEHKRQLFCYFMRTFVLYLPVNLPGKTVLVFDQESEQDHKFGSEMEEVFGAVAKNIVEGCVDGYNGTIFAYGQTGSGKTFTMLGPAEGEAECFTHELRGVIPRCFEYLFSLIKREQEK
ncbi:predicted protein, partial [Nematostella vectensis]